METVLVTGGAGFIGSNIAEALIDRGARVVALDDLSSGRLENIDHLLHNRNFTFTRGSILDTGLLRSVLKTYQVSAICHQAANPSVAKSIVDPVRSIETNITGTANVFDLASEYCCRRIVFASSCAVYGYTPESPAREQAPLNPRSPFAVTKATKEMLAKNFCDLHAIEIVGLRYFNVYGRRQPCVSEPMPVILAFIGRALRNQPLVVEGDGLQTRDFVYVEDVVQANLQALAARSVSGRCFNVGSGTSVSVLELAKTVIRLTGSSSPITSRPARPGDVRNSLADIKASREAFGYVPAFTLEQGLQETIAWLRQKEARFLKASPLHGPVATGKVASDAGQ